MADTPRKSNQPPEKPNDPYRHARGYLKKRCVDAQGRKTLRFWRGEWWRWSEGRYHPVSLNQLRGELTKALKQTIDNNGIRGGDGRAVPVTNALVTNVLGALAAEVLVPDSIAQPAWLVPGITSESLATTNGLVSLGGADMGVCHPHSPEWFSSVCIPYDYNPDATCPQWEAFLNKVLEADVERIAVMQEWFGYLLTPDTSLHKFMVLEGDGANGKSVVLEVLEAMLGAENVSHVQLEVFGQRFQLHMTLNKLLNTAPEVNEHVKLDEGAIKAFVAGDVMYWDRKGISGISVKPTARLMVATNSRPAIANRSQGMWRRMLLLPFRVTIPPAEQDRELARKLKVELPGILNWAIIGRRRLYQQNRFTTSAVSEAATAEYRAESNPAQQFLTEYCHLGSSKDVLAAEVYQTYAYWAKFNHHPVLNAAQFGRELRKHYPSVVKKREGSGARRWVYVGFSVDDLSANCNVSIEEDAA